MKNKTLSSRCGVNQSSASHLAAAAVQPSMRLVPVRIAPVALSIRSQRTGGGPVSAYWSFTGSSAWTAVDEMATEMSEQEFLQVNDSTAM